MLLILGVFSVTLAERVFFRLMERTAVDFSRTQPQLWTADEKASRESRWMRLSWLRILVTLTLLCSVSLCGCATEMVKFRSDPHLPIDDFLNISSWRGPQPSDRTRLFLRMVDLERTFEYEPARALEQVRTILRNQPTAEYVYYYAELSYVAGCREERNGSGKAIEYFTASTMSAYRYLFQPEFMTESNPYDPQFRRACDIYNSSLEKSLRIIQKRSQLLPDRQYDIEILGERQTITSRLRNSQWKPMQIDHFEFVSDYKLEGLKNHHSTYGLGVPLIAVCKISSPRQGTDKYLPPSCCFPVTAFLRPNMDTDLPSAIHPLDLYDTLSTVQISIHGQTVSLESDFSTVLAWQLSGADEMKLSTLGLLHPQKMLGSFETLGNHPLFGKKDHIAGFTESSALHLSSTHGTSSDAQSEQTVETETTCSLTQQSSGTTVVLGNSTDSNTGRIAGLYMIQPYQPGKIPVVLIHGLWSSPLTWIQMFNDLYSDPTIRQRYQFWFYLYPTGVPYWSSAALLRHDMAELRQTINSNHQDPSLDKMVLVGHSMGGLLAEMQILSSGDEVWKLVSDVPLEELHASPEIKQVMRETFFFESNPSVRCVITLGTPHRGSKVANNTTQWFATKLIHWSAQLMQSRQALFLDNPGVIPSDSLLRLETSVDSLAPSTRLHETLLELPTPTGVHRHNIMGDLPPEGIWKAFLKKHSGDGIVECESAHLDAAESEIAVPADHVSIHSNARAILEVRRILYENLKTDDVQVVAPVQSLAF